MDAVAEGEGVQPEGWNELVAAMLSLVVQHCPAASQHPRDPCTLLQVSTACRTALQHTKGHCCPVIGCTIKRRTNALFSYIAWAGQHSSLVKQLSVDLTMDLKRPEILQDVRFAAAFTSLSKLSSFTVGSQYTLGQQLLGSLQTQSQLTRVCLDMVTADVITHLPPSPVDVRLVVNITASIALPGVQSMFQADQTLHISFLHLQKLQGLEFKLWSMPYSKPVNEMFKGVVLSVPPALLQLHLSGPVSAVHSGMDASLPTSLEQLVVGKGVFGVMSVATVAKVVAGMPKLQHFGMDASLAGPQDAYHAWTGVNVLPRLRYIEATEAQPLLEAVGAAMQLTALRIAGLSVPLDEWESEGDSEGEMEGAWGQRLRHLTALQALELSGELGNDDIAAIASMTQLTSLHLTSCGGYVDDNAIEDLLSPLTGLQLLTIHDADLWYPEALFGAVAGLTNLRSLDLHHNFVNDRVQYYAEDTKVLRSLVGLTHLVLPPLKSRACTADEVLSRLLRHLPALVVAKAGHHTLL